MKELDLGKDRIGKLLLRFSIPCVVSMLVNALYNIVDQVFIGQGVGYLGNAATNIVFPFTVLSLSIALLIGDGSAALFSLSKGRKDDETALKSVGNCIILAVISAIVLTAIGFIFKDSLLKLFGATDECYMYAKEYMTIILFGIPFFIIGASINGIIRADGAPKYSMIATLVGAIINLILDPIAIFVLHIGVKGAAIATIFGQIISCIIGLLYLRRGKNFKINKNSLIIDKQTVKRICLLGISSFITQISMVVIISIANNLIVKYGSMSKYGPNIPLSAVGIVMKVFGIIIAFIVGISVGGQPIVGYNYGAEKYDRVKKTYRLMIISNLIVGTIGFIIFQFFPDVIIKLFGNESDLYNEYARLCFKIYLSGILLCCVTKTTSIFLQAIGKSIKSMILSISRDIVLFAPGLIILASMFGVVGMLWAAPIADVIAFILAIIFIILEFKSLKKYEKNDEREENITEKIEKKKPLNGNIVITISREYGSGGRYVGQLLAKMLNINFYDEELIKIAAKETGFSEEYIKSKEQKEKGTYNDDELFLEESKIIKEKAEKESCIIVGRCADYILREKNNVLKIFLYSSLEDKVNRVVKYYKVPKEKAETQINKINKEREKHYKFYTGRQWKNFENYDLSLNVSILGVKETAEIIRKTIESM